MHNIWGWDLISLNNLVWLYCLSHSTALSHLITISFYYKLFISCYLALHLRPYIAVHKKIRLPRSLVLSLMVKLLTYRLKGIGEHNTLWLTSNSAQMNKTKHQFVTQYLTWFQKQSLKLSAISIYHKEDYVIFERRHELKAEISRNKSHQNFNYSSCGLWRLFT